jgi:hypothetical protein
MFHKQNKGQAVHYAAKRRQEQKEKEDLAKEQCRLRGPLV